MTGKVSGKNAVILIGGYDFSTYSNKYDIAMDSGKVDVTGFGDGSNNSIPGEPKAVMSVSMLWDSAANKVHAALASMPSGKNVTILPEGGTLGYPSLSMPFMQGNYNPSASPESAISVGTINFESYGNNAGVESGWCLAHNTVTTTTTGTGYDDPTGGAVTAACAGTLHVWTPTSTDTYVVKIQHSTSLASGYVDLVTFTLNGTARNSERVTVASGTVNRYRRILATRTGSAGDSFGFSVHFWHA